MLNVKSYVVYLTQPEATAIERFPYSRNRFNIRCHSIWGNNLFFLENFQTVQHYIGTAEYTSGADSQVFYPLVIPVVNFCKITDKYCITVDPLIVVLSPIKPTAGKTADRFVNNMQKLV